MTTVTRTPGPGRANLRAFLEQIKGTIAQVGWFESAKYPNGTSVAYVASIHEYGYEPKHIAPRMGLRGMFPEKRANWAKFAEYGAKNALTGSGTIFDMFEGVGGAAAADIRKQIASVKEPILADATLLARAHALGLEDISDLTGTGSKPLVEPARKDGGAGLLIASVTHLTHTGEPK